MRATRRGSKLRGGGSRRKVDTQREKMATGGAARVADAPARRDEIDILNTAELRANSQKVLSLIHSKRPKNTMAVYMPKQREFQAFCQQKQYQDSDTVTEDKILLFLVEEVTNRPLRGKSRKAAPETKPEETRLAWRSVRAYISALTDLYRIQKAKGMNSHPSPREDNVREYLKSLQRRDAEREKAL